MFRLDRCLMFIVCWVLQFLRGVCFLFFALSHNGANSTFKDMTSVLPTTRWCFLGFRMLDVSPSGRSALFYKGVWVLSELGTGALL